MGFSWTEDISVGAIIHATDINEVKTNIDTIYTYREITRNGCASGAGWSELPVSPGGPIESADIQELRDAADYAQENICGTNFSGEHLNENQTNKTAVYDTYVSSENNGDEVADNTYEKYAHVNTDDGWYCTIAYSSYQADACGQNYITEDSGYNMYEYASHDITVHGTDTT